MRYVIALVAAAMIIAGGFVFIRLTHRSLENHIRLSLRKLQQAGTLPPELQGVDIDSMNLHESLPDVAMQLPRALETRLKMSMWLSDFWFVWAPLTVALCVGLAALAGRLRAEP